MGKINPKNTASTSHSAADDALRVLVRMRAQQAARDWLAGSSHPADQTQCEEVIHDQA